jgi:hypothetical protein
VSLARWNGADPVSVPKCNGAVALFEAEARGLFDSLVLILVRSDRQASSLKTGAPPTHRRLNAELVVPLQRMF